MAVVFLLGPGMWEPSRRAVGDPSPMHVRRSIGKTLKEHGHRVILMEDDPDRAAQGRLLAGEL